MKEMKRRTEDLGPKTIMSDENYLERGCQICIKHTLVMYLIVNLYL